MLSLPFSFDKSAPLLQRHTKEADKEGPADPGNQDF